MSDENTQQELQVSNPFQAITEIFYSPKGVFEALAVKNNWSWVPFILLAVILFIPPYLYFGVVNFEWWLDTSIAPSLEDLAPSQQEAMLAGYTTDIMKWTSSIFTLLFMVVWFAIVAFYLSLVTKNDDKSVQGFTDWYGVMWWVSLPAIIGALISLVLLSMQEANTEISMTILGPLSVAYILDTPMSSPWFNFLLSLRIDTFWSIWLTAVCVGTWTNFSKSKALIVAFIPSGILWLISLGGALTA